MIRWITPEFGTAPYHGVPPGEAVIVDVRDLVDGEGNSEELLWQKVSAAADALASGRRVIVCCDFGISRSNSIAMAALACWRGIPFPQAQRMVLDTTGEREMRIDVLNAVRRAFERRRPASARRPVKTTVLITGASGSIGRAASSRLAESASVIGLSSTDVDLARDAASLDLAVKEHGVRRLVHFAHPRRSGTAGALGQSISMLKNVLDVCLANEVHLVFVSSWEVFSGQTAERFDADESAKRLPKSMVGIAKSLGEDLLATAGERLPLTIVRPARIYGGASPSPKVLRNFADRCLKGEPIVLHKFRNGLALLDFVHVDDVASGIQSILAKGATGVFHLGGEQPLRTDELLEALAARLGKKCRQGSQPIDSWAANVALRSERARVDLGWRREHTLQDGLAEIALAARDKEDR
jgi:nucleoside-diphosphate-sugar epimerase